MPVEIELLHRVLPGVYACHLLFLPNPEDISRRTHQSISIGHTSNLLAACELPARFLSVPQVK
jgi:hypothetical protein